MNRIPELARGGSLQIAQSTLLEGLATDEWATRGEVQAAKPSIQNITTAEGALRDMVQSIVDVANAIAKGKSAQEGARAAGINAAAQTMQAAVAQLVDEHIASHAALESARFIAPDSHAPGYEAALAAGAEARTRIFDGPDMLSSQTLAARLGVSRETVNQRRRSGELLALENERRGFRYPAWQIEPAVRDTIAPVLEALGSDANCWAAYLFLTQEHPLLGGKTPLQALQAGQFSRVLRAAAAMRQELV